MFILPTEDVPPPTNDDVAERLVKRLLILCQRGEWDIAGENLKVVWRLSKYCSAFEFERFSRCISAVSGDDGDKGGGGQACAGVGCGQRDGHHAAHVRHHREQDADDGEAPGARLRHQQAEQGELHCPALW